MVGFCRPAPCKYDCWGYCCAPAICSRERPDPRDAGPSDRSIMVLRLMTTSAVMTSSAITERGPCRHQLDAPLKLVGAEVRLLRHIGDGMGEGVLANVAREV